MAIFVYPRWPSAAILDFHRTANSAIWSAGPENPALEPNMEWIGCTVCEIFAFKLYCDLETGVQSHSRSSKVAIFDRAHTTLYSSSIVNMPHCPCLLLFPRYSHILVENRYPLYSAPQGWSHQIYAATLGDEKRAYQKVEEFRWYLQPFWYNTRVWQTDGQTDGIAVAYRRYSIMLPRVKIDENRRRWG